VAVNFPSSSTWKTPSPKLISPFLIVTVPLLLTAKLPSLILKLPELSTTKAVLLILKLPLLSAIKAPPPRLI